MSESENFEKICALNEEAAERVRAKVYGTIILSKDNMIIQTSFDTTTTQGVAHSVAGTLVNMARSAVRDIDPTDDLHFLRIYTKKAEWMVGPNDEFTLIVQQT